jgi:hypothetical protein
VPVTEQRTKPDGFESDEEAMVAAVELVGRTGARHFQFGFLDENAPIDKARWYAHAEYRGTRIIAEDHVGPVEAAEALAARLLHGGMCKGCGKVIAINDDPVPIPEVLIDGTRVDPEEAKRRGLCRWFREGVRWMRGCGEDAPAGSTRERLARAMAEAGVPGVAIRDARLGYYDEYMGPLPFPISTLVADLEKNGFPELAARARAGEFNATKQESDAWAASEEGRATFAEFVGSALTGAKRAEDKPTAENAGADATFAVVDETHRLVDETRRRRPWRSNQKKSRKKRK